MAESAFKDDRSKTVPEPCGRTKSLVLLL